MKYRIIATILLILALGLAVVYEESDSSPSSAPTHRDNGGITLQ